MELIKINIENLNSPTSEVFSAATDYITSYDLSKSGNVVYYGHLKGDTNSNVYRIKKANGGIINLPSHTRDFWIGLDQHIYYHNSAEGSQKIKKVTITAPDYTFETTDYGNDISMNDDIYNQYKLELSDKIFIIGTSDGKIYEVYNSAGTPRVVNLAGLSFSSISSAGSSNNYYYVAGTVSSNGELYKINPNNDTYSKILDGYDVYKMTVSANDEIVFNALRMSDGHIVIGKIDSSGTLSILDDTINSQVDVLERVN